MEKSCTEHMKELELKKEELLKKGNLSVSDKAKLDDLEKEISGCYLYLVGV